MAKTSTWAFFGLFRQAENVYNTTFAFDKNIAESFSVMVAWGGHVYLSRKQYQIILIYQEH